MLCILAFFSRESLRKIKLIYLLILILLISFHQIQILHLWVLLCELPMGGSVISKTSLCHSHACTLEDLIEHQ